MKYCKNCGAELDPEFKFCVNCGTPVPNKENEMLENDNESEAKISDTDTKAENEIQEEKVEDLEISDETKLPSEDIENKEPLQTFEKPIEDNLDETKLPSEDIENKEPLQTFEKPVEDNLGDKTPNNENNKVNLKGIFKVSLIANTITLIVMLILTLVVVSKLMNDPSGYDIANILQSEVSIFSFFIYIFWITIAINIIIIIYSIFGKKSAFFNKVKNKTYLYLVVSAILIIVSFTPFRVILAIKKISSSVFSFNFGGAMPSALRLAQEDPELVGTLFVITLILLIINSIISIIFFRAVPFKAQDEISLDNIDKEKINQGINASKDAAKKSVEVGSDIAKKGLTSTKAATKKGLASTKEAAQQGLNKLKEKRNNMSKKNKVISIIILVIIVGGIGTGIYFSQFKKTNVDILEDIKIEYNGVSGYAKATIDESSIKIFNDAMVNDFVNKYVDFTILPNENLKEGDTIKVVIEPDVAVMKNYKINLKNLQKEFKVTGLDKYPESLSDISGLKPFIDTSLTTVSDRIKDSLTSSIYYEYKDVKTSYVETCLVKDLDQASYGGKVITIYNIFKTTYSEKYSNKWESKTQFEVAKNDKDVILNSKGELKEDIIFSMEGFIRESLNNVKSDLPYNAKCEVIK